MKFNLRWQLLLALISFGLVLSLLSVQSQSDNLCSTRIPAAGGTFVEGFVGAPRFLNPLLSDSYPVERQLVDLVFDGLTRTNEKGELIPSLALGWDVSEDGLNVTFTLRQDVQWHDDVPFTADDVVYTYGLLQQEAFPGSPALRQLWQAVTINKVTDFEVSFTLPEPYAPFLTATTRGILPAHLLAGVDASNLVDAPFNRAPVGTGPFMVAAGQNWEGISRLRLTPHPADWRQGTRIAQLEYRFYPNPEQLVAAYLAGEVQALNSVPYPALPQVAGAPGSRLISVPTQRFTSLLFNLSDSGAPLLKTAANRRALAQALDRRQIIESQLNGQGLLFEGPYLPGSWAYTPLLLTAITPDPEAAAALLDEAGWVLPEGGSIRANDQGPLVLTLLSLDVDLHRRLAAAVAQQWAAVGVGTEIVLAGSAGELLQLLGQRAFDAAIVDISPDSDPDLYDFWSQEAIVRGQNYAGWNNRRASEALEKARGIWDNAERKPFYDAFLRQFDTGIPAVTLFQHVTTYALSGDVKEAEIGRFSSPREKYNSLANWFLFYRDVTIGCPNADN